MNKVTGSHVIKLAVYAALMIFALFLASCEEKTGDVISTDALKEKVENKTQAYMTDLRDSATSLDSNENIAKYILNWADSKGIRARTDGSIIVMNVDGSENYKDARKTVLVCPYDEDDPDSTMNVLVPAFYVLRNNEDTGRMSALFVPESSHDLSSADKLQKKYFGKKSNVLCLSSGEYASVAKTTGGASRYRFSKDYAPAKPRNRQAYKITISGINSSHIDNRINSKINPIVELNSLLAGLKSSSVDFEIASFKGGKDGFLYPGKCTLIITVDEDRRELFESRIASRIESFDKRKKASDPDAVYEFEETGLPRRVISQKDSSKLVGFIYTLLEDEFHRDEDTDTLMAVCDVSYIRIKNGKVRIGSSACSIDQMRLYEIDEAEKTLSDLSGFRYERTFTYPCWIAEDAETSELTEAFRSAYKKYTGKKLKIDPQVTPEYTSAVYELQDKCDILSVTVSDNTLTDLTGTIMEYLIRSNEKVDD